MKVDEKMIEAGAKAYIEATADIIEQHFDPLPDFFVRWDSAGDEQRELARIAMRAAFTAMLSAAPTDYGELVRRLREDACSREGWPDELEHEAADAIELLSALSVVHSKTT